MLGYERRELVGKTVDGAQRRIRTASGTIEAFGALVRGEVSSYEHEMRYKRKNGSTMWANVSVTYVPEDDEPFAIAVVDDVSDRIVIRDRLIHEATHDALTGLPNRGLFSAQLGDALRARLAGPRGRVRRPRPLQDRQRQPRAPRRRRAACARSRSACARSCVPARWSPGSAATSSA